MSKQLLTAPSLLVRKSAKRVGTNPGATQLTLVSGLISDARPYITQQPLLTKIKIVNQYQKIHAKNLF